MKALRDQWRNERRISPRAVHATRVAIRRSRSVLWVCRRSGAQKSFLRLDRKLRQLGRALGAVRELDVAIADANVLNLKREDKRRLKHLRHRARTKLGKLLLNAKVHRRLKQSLVNASKKLAKPSLMALQPELARIRRELRKQFKGWDKQNLDLHRMRILAKRARYIREACGQSADSLKIIQNKLGMIHDLEVLEDLLGHANKTIEKEKARRYRHLIRALDLPLLV